MRRASLLFPLLAIAVLAPGRPASAEVARVVVDRREDVLGGKEWGDVGAYEKLVGRIYFAFDPGNPANGAIVDLTRAPLNAAGKVEAWAEFMVLQPKDPAKRRGVAWLEVPNRGRKASLQYFNRATRSSLDPTSPADFGDGLLFTQGLTVVWVGWQWDVPEQAGLIRLHVPFARLSDGPITGLVRSDWTVDADTDVLGLSHRGHRAYAAMAPDDSANVLTVRDGRDAPRMVVPRSQWHFLAPTTEGSGADRLTQISLDGGFRAGKIYELVYKAQDPRIVGLGLAAIRDVASYMKYEIDSEFPVQKVVAFGASQTGRFLRHYLYQGFNADERGRIAVDGMLIHKAGAGRGSFNHRFAQPSRDAHRYSAFFYPTDIFPFTSRTETDPLTGVSDGLMDHTPDEDRPKVFFTNSGYEYWGRAASLIHTSADGVEDVQPLPTERIYELAGGQHSVGGFPPAEGTRMGDGPAYRGDPLDYGLTLRALAVSLVAWVADGAEPPPSRYPHIADGTLVPVYGLAFPRIPGVDVARVAEVAYRADYGPRFATQGIVDKQPPDLGPAFPSLVPQVDGLGNEMSGVREVELRVPVATYAPWNLRVGYPAAQDELVDFLGTWIPLPANETERARAADPRPSLAALYGGRDDFMARVRQAAADLAAERFLLPEDEAVAVSRAAAMWDWVQRHAEGPES